MLWPTLLGTHPAKTPKSLRNLVESPDWEHDQQYIGYRLGENMEMMMMMMILVTTYGGHVTVFGRFIYINYVYLSSPC